MKVPNTFNLVSGTKIIKAVKWDRKNCCPYCDPVQLVTNFTRHLKRKHSTETRVIDYLSTPSGPERLRIAEEIRNRGNFIYNSKRCENFLTDFIPKRRPTKKNKNDMSALTYAVCKYCLATMKKTSLWRHINKNKCPAYKVSKENSTDGSRNRVLKSSSILLIPSCGEDNAAFKEAIFPVFRDDNISLVAKTDKLIISFGARFYKSHRAVHKKTVVTKKMRDLAKVVLKAREKDASISNLTECLHPHNFSTLIWAIQNLMKFNETTGEVGVISVSGRLQTSLRTCLDIIYGNALMDSSVTETQLVRIETYTKRTEQLLKSNWAHEISSNAEASRKTKSMLKPTIMPCDDDIYKVTKFIQEEEKRLLTKLSKDVSMQNYLDLCEICIAHIIIFNKRRQGEVCRAELEYYLKRDNQEVGLDVQNFLSEKQQQAMESLTLFQVPGKLVRMVPILLTSLMKECVDLIVSCRNTLNLTCAENNKLLFPRPNTLNAFDGCKILRDLREKCRVKNYRSFTSTGMRHRVATKAQIVQNNDMYKKNLPTYMGHTEGVHNSNYRLPLAAIQKGIVGSLFMEEENMTSQLCTRDSKKDSLNNVKSKSSQETSKDSTFETDTALPASRSKVIGTRSSKRKPQNSESEEYVTESDENEDGDEDDFTPIPRRKTHKKDRWSAEQNRVVLDKFSHFFSENRNPGKMECLKLLRAEPVLLRNRTWEQLNAHCSNIRMKGKGTKNCSL